MAQSFSRSDLAKKWDKVLNHESLPAISSKNRAEDTAVLLENTINAIKSEREMLMEASPANSVGGYSDTGGFAKYDPVLISLVRRAIPQLVAYDVCGVQPMSQPTGLIFAMKSRYGSQSGAEALYNEADAGFSGTGVSQTGTSPVTSPYTVQGGIATATAEAGGSVGGQAINQMAFTIEKVPVAAKERMLQAQYSIELAQDMKAIHGLDAETELTNILATEITAEINREVLRTIYSSAKTGAIAGTQTQGIFDLDVDSNGRWSVEKFKGLLYQIEREANVVAQQTRLGKGNIIICSSDVASALAMTGMLDYAPAISKNADLNVDEASTTFAGILNGRYKVYVDPYSGNSNANPGQFMVVGYKGNNNMAAGLFYCPYVPLQLMKAIDPSSYQPRIAFKTRYAIQSNPMISLDSGSNDPTTSNSNYFYRKVAINNLM